MKKAVATITTVIVSLLILSGCSDSGKNNEDSLIGVYQYDSYEYKPVSGDRGLLWDIDPERVILNEVPYYIEFTEEGEVLSVNIEDAVISVDSMDYWNEAFDSGIASYSDGKLVIDSIDYPTIIYRKLDDEKIPAYRRAIANYKYFGN